MTSLGDRLHDVLNMVNWIRNSSILCLRRIGIVDHAAIIYRYIFQQCITANGLVNIRLALFAQVDGLCITTTLEIEYTIVIPAMFIIADEGTLRVGGKGCLASS